MADVDVATLHDDCNTSHTISLYNVTPFLNDLERFSENTRNCLCTLREIVLHSHLANIDISNSSNEAQLQFLTRLASERFTSKCFTDSNHTICIRIFLTSPDLEVYISNWNVEQLEVYASRFMNEASQIPVDVKLHLACFAKDHEYVNEVLRETHTTDLKKKDMLFYGISCGEIVDALVQSGADVNTKDARGRTPLFYALTSSLDSANMLLDRGARMTAKDGCRVSVLTFFAENMFKNHLPADVTVEGIQLLSERLPNRTEMIKEVINLMLCKFVQVLGTIQRAPNPQDNYLSSNMLCELLELVLSHANDGTRADDRNKLINQLQSLQERINADNFVNLVSNVLQSFDKLGADPLAPDSEGNTSLHYATQLLFYGVPEETVTDLCHKLMHMKGEARLDVKNHKKETPLLFCLSSKHLIASTEASNWSGCLWKVCEFLMEKGSELSHTNHKEESAFQLILKVCQYAILLQDKHQKLCIFEEMIEILSKFSGTEEVHVAVNKRDKHLNSPLHLWASLAHKPSSLYDEKCGDYSFEDFMSEILDRLVNKCDIQRDDANKKGQKPLHLCRTWTAVKLLIDAGAEPDVKDSSGCTPLLVAAKRNTCIKKDSKRFYPDVDQTPKEFWKEAVLNRKLDPWTADKNGDSVLSILIEKEANHLAKALIEVACEPKCVQSDAIQMSLLITICRDKSTEKEWKVDLVKTLLVCRKSLAQRRSSDKDTALHCCCMLGLPEESVKTSVHWKIAQYLLLGGVDMKAAGKPEDSCLRLLQRCPVIRKQLSTEVDPSKLPLVLENWKQSSRRHAQQLSMVARMVKCRQVGGLNFYEEALEKKSPGDFVFAGIVQDGREVAVKRIDKSKMSHENGLENVLVLSRRCEHIVQYLLSEKQGNFHYLAFELMEGDLEHYLDRRTGAEDPTKLCKDLLMGLQFLQSQDIPVIHGSINPRTVFYQSEPNVCLKIGNCKTSSLRIGWIAPEVLKGETFFSKESDIFSCGLVLHYLLSGKKHPFAPAYSATKTPEEVLNETDTNIRDGNIVRIDDSLSPEAVHLVRLMLDSDPSNRPSPSDALVHPFFWDNETKKKFLHVVGNEPEIAMQVRPYPLTAFESEVEGRFNDIVTRGTTWNDSPPYDNMQVTYAGMRIRRDYDYETVAGLIRFIRNAYEHINEQPERIQKMWDDDFVLNDYFPHLVIEVYKALTTSTFHQLHESRRGIMNFFSKLTQVTGF